MPWVNWCKKCKGEVPLGETCAYCGAKLTKTGERLSFGGLRTPVADWFEWNAMLRIYVPVVGLVLAITVLIELLTEGSRGVQAVFVSGFFWVLMAVLAFLLLVTLMVLSLQGTESVHYVLDSKGAHMAAYLQNPSSTRLYARLLSPASVAAMQEDEQAIEGFTLIRRVDLLWADMKRVRFWPETGSILFYRPRLWLMIPMRCGEAEYAEAEAFARKKLNRNKKAIK